MPDPRSIHLLFAKAAAQRDVAARLSAAGYALCPCANVFDCDCRAGGAPDVLVAEATSVGDAVALLGRARDACVPVVLVAATGCDIRFVVRALREGAQDIMIASASAPEWRECIERAVAAGSRWQDERTQRARARELIARLTPREREVLRYLLAGRVNKQIAGYLECEVATIKVHRSRLMRKLEVRSPFELVAVAQLSGFHSAHDDEADAPRAVARSDAYLNLGAIPRNAVLR